MHIEHTYSYTRSNNLSKTLDRFVAAGFQKAANTSLHTMGRRCGFLNLSGSYLEVIAIENESEFSAAATADDCWVRMHPRPCGMAIAAPDVDQLFQRLRTLHPTIEPPVRRTRGDDPAGPAAWEFLYLPTVATPGVQTFAVKYLQRAMGPYAVTMGNNTVFALGGLMFCADQPRENAAQWQRTLSLLAPCESIADCHFRWGPQNLVWWTTEEYHARFRCPWIPSPTSIGATCALRLLAESLEVATRYFERAGFTTIRHPADPHLYIAPDEDTGYAFVIEQCSAEEFVRQLE